MGCSKSSAKKISIALKAGIRKLERFITYNLSFNLRGLQNKEKVIQSKQNKINKKIRAIMKLKTGNQ